MAISGGNYTGKHAVAPKALKAVAGNGKTILAGDLRTNLEVGEPAPEEVAIFINGVNLVDIIAALQAADAG